MCIRWRCPSDTRVPCVRCWEGIGTMCTSRTDAPCTRASFNGDLSDLDCLHSNASGMCSEHFFAQKQWKVVLTWLDKATRAQWTQFFWQRLMQNVETKTSIKRLFSEESSSARAVIWSISQNMRIIIQMCQDWGLCPNVVVASLQLCMKSIPSNGPLWLVQQVHMIHSREMFELARCTHMHN
jgi:hypothetical protein